MLRRFLWKGLDLDRFEIVAIWPQNKTDAVILMRSRWREEDLVPWCVQFRGQGRYFWTAGEAIDYCVGRGFKLETEV